METRDSLANANSAIRDLRDQVIKSGGGGADKTSAVDSADSSTSSSTSAVSDGDRECGILDPCLNWPHLLIEEHEWKASEA